MNAIARIFNKPQVSIKVQTLAALIATAAAVALPQLCHLIGGISLSTALLPMHLPILLVGLLAGPVAGAAAGVLSPVVSFALTGMPLIGNLPLMMAELLVYGLTAGLLRNTKLPSMGKVLLAQLAGRLCYAGVLALAIYAFGNAGHSMTSALASSTSGIWGTLLQLTLIPLILKMIKR